MMSLNRGPLVIAHVVEASDGGVATFVSALIESQKKDTMFASVHLLADQNTGAEKKMLSRPHVLHRYNSSRNPLWALKIAKELHTQLTTIEPDVVILHSSFPGAWGRIYKGRWKTIYCSHGWSFTQDINSVSKALYRRIESVLSRRCDSIVSISEDEFRQGHNAGVPDDIHKVILHGVPAATLATTPVFPLDLETINLAFVGRFERQKGIDVLCDIFDDARLDHITLWLAGGDIRGVNRYVLPARKNLRPVGWLDAGQVDALLQQVDGLIVPSRWEGFGLVALEAMRNGKPVIANRIGGLAELITDGVNGRLIDIHDIAACRNILVGLNKLELTDMGEAAYATYEREFRWDVCYAKWRDLIANVANLPARDRSLTKSESIQSPATSLS